MGTGNVKVCHKKAGIKDVKKDADTETPFSCTSNSDSKVTVTVLLKILQILIRPH